MKRIPTTPNIIYDGSNCVVVNMLDFHHSDQSSNIGREDEIALRQSNVSSLWSRQMGTSLITVIEHKGKEWRPPLPSGRKPADRPLRPLI